MPTYICESMQSWSPDNTVTENSKRLIYLSHSMSILGPAYYAKVILKLFRSAILSVHYHIQGFTSTFIKDSNFYVPVMCQTISQTILHILFDKVALLPSVIMRIEAGKRGTEKLLCWNHFRWEKQSRCVHQRRQRKRDLQYSNGQQSSP